MKTFNFLKVWAVLFATVAFSGVLTSCSDDDDPAVPTDWIADEWDATGELTEVVDGEDEETYTMSFSLDIKADGTCVDRYEDFNRWWLSGSTFGLGWYEDGEMWDAVQGNFEKVNEDKFTVKVDFTESGVDEDSFGDNDTHTVRTYGTLTFTRK